MSRPTSGPAQFDTNQTNAAPPTSGRILNGYGLAGPLPSSDLNYLFNDHGVWLKYLSDGDIVLDGVVYGTTAVAISPAVVNNFDPFAGTFAGKAIVQLTGGGVGPPAPTITGIVSSGAEEGRSFWLVNETGNPVVINIEDSGSSAANRIDCANAPSGAAITMPPKGALFLTYSDPPTGRWAVRASNFAIDFSTRTRTDTYGPSTCREIGGSTHTLNVGFLTTGGSSTNVVIWPLVIESDRTITAWNMYIDKTSTSATLVAELWKINMVDGSATNVSATSTSAVAPGFISLGASGLTEAVGTSYQYYVRLSPGGAFAPDDLIYGVRLTTTKTGL